MWTGTLGQGFAISQGGGVAVFAPKRSILRAIPNLESTAAALQALRPRPATARFPLSDNRATALLSLRGTFYTLQNRASVLTIDLDQTESNEFGLY
jgi:hypothetical protein